MKKIVIDWRKSTDEELASGSSEMIKISETEIEVDDLPNEKIDISKIDIDTLTNNELVKLANRLKPHLK